MALKQDLTIRQGETFTQIVRWEVPPVVYKPISAITQTAPVAVTATAHGLSDGWRVALVSIKGMTQLNAANDPPRDTDYHIATVTSANSFVINDVNAASYKAYVSGGYVQYNSAQDLTGHIGRLTIKDKIGGTVLLSLTTSNGGIVIDPTAKTIQIYISAVDTAAITWTKGVYDFELESPAEKVTCLMYGAIKITQEVTT